MTFRTGNSDSIDHSSETGAAEGAPWNTAIQSDKVVHNAVHESEPSGNRLSVAILSLMTDDTTSTESLNQDAFDAPSAPVRCQQLKMLD